MKTMSFLASAFTFFIFFGAISGCSDDDDQTTTDILEEDWRLTSVLVENESTSLSEDDYPKELSYVLSFTDDTTFAFYTSVNAAYGTYIIERDSVGFNGYQEYSEVMALDPKLVGIDEILVIEVNNVTKYSINNDELTLYWETGQLVFKKYDRQ